MKIGSSANATGTGVTFFNTYPGTQMNKYDGMRISTSGTVSFTAPTTGSNKALLFYQDPRCPGLPITDHDHREYYVYVRWDHLLPLD